MIIYIYIQYISKVFRKLNKLKTSAILGLKHQWYPSQAKGTLRVSHSSIKSGFYIKSDKFCFDNKTILISQR